MPSLIRPMCEQDLEAAAQVWWAAFQGVFSPIRDASTQSSNDDIERSVRRSHYLLGTDPGGAFIAELDGSIVAAAMSHVRGDLFVLAILGVLPDHQEGGLGHRLLARTLDYGSSAARAFIFSSPDPRALHRYLGAGFALHPAMAAEGWLMTNGTPTHLRLTQGSQGDRQFVDDVDKVARGATRRGDIDFQLDEGSDLYIDDEGAYALVSMGRVLTLGATNEAVARRSLSELLSGQVTGQPLTTQWLTSDQQWAFSSVSESRATLRPHGAVMFRGEGPLPGPYLPSGIFG